MTDAERAQFLELRRAFDDGAAFGAANGYSKRSATCEARARYPLPPRTRPRVVADPGNEQYQWRAVGRRVEFRFAGNGSAKPSEWIVYLSTTKAGTAAGTPGFDPNPERVALWNDLYANPTEPIPEE